jgi:integrase
MLVLAYWKHAQVYYGAAGTADKGKGELTSIRLMLKSLTRLYADTPAESFGPLAFKAVRESMIAGGWCRSYVNQQAGRLKRVFGWGVENELVPPGVFHGLQAVRGLRMGRTAARESEPVRPVPDAHVAAVRPHVSRQIRAMIDLQLLTGMRPGEVCAMRGCDVDTTGRLWLYRPERHKTQHHGHARTVYLGPAAQAVLRPFLRTDLAAYLFSPIEAEDERRAALSKKRAESGTPLSCGNVPGSNRVRKPKRGPRERYTTISYHQAIRRGCEAAWPPPAHLARLRVPGGRPGKDGKPLTRRETPAEWKARLGPEGWKELAAWNDARHWHPHQLRHNAATRLRKDYGLEAAQVILGHATLSVTEIYAEKNVAQAMRIMGEVG